MGEEEQHFITAVLLSYSVQNIWILNIYSIALEEVKKPCSQMNTDFILLGQESTHPVHLFPGPASVWHRGKIFKNAW